MVLSLPNCVRSIVKIDHNIIYNNGTVKDTKTELTWKRCSEGLSGGDCSQGKAKGYYSWQEAKDHAKQVHFAGYSDWRLPTIKELKTLVYCSNGTPQANAWSKTCSGQGEKTYDKNPYQRPTINQAIFPNTKTSYYWSASPYKESSSDTLVVYFYNGQTYYAHNKAKNNKNNKVRLVRGRGKYFW